MHAKRTRSLSLSLLGIVLFPGLSVCAFSTPERLASLDRLASEEDLGAVHGALLEGLRAKPDSGSALEGKAVRSAVQSRIKMDKSLIHLVDGDTIIYGAKGGEKLNIRILGMDTPEVHHYSAGKFEDQEFGQKAKEYVRGVLQRAKKVEYLPCGNDIYDRVLAHVYVDDQLLAVRVLKRGYAYETISYYGDNGHPDIAAEILEAAKAGQAPQFENPYLWRKKMWSPEREKEQLAQDMAAPRIEVDKSQITFQDGDTVYFGSTEVRILGIDTPEIAHPEHDKPEGQPYGPEAAEFAKQAILGAKKVEYSLGPGSTYGRALGHVFVDGELLSMRLIKAGLAYETVSRYGAGGFPGYARQLMEAFRAGPKPPFQNPQYWRWENWKEPKPDPIDSEDAPL